MTTHHPAHPDHPVHDPVHLDRSGSGLDHLDLAVPDLAAAVAFYEPVLASIEVVRILAVPAAPGRPAMTGFGWAGVKPFSWLVDGGTVGTDMHVAFTVATRADVERFHAAALAGGATERHAPAVWTDDHDDYDGGFVDDPHGINLEAVCHHRPPAPTGPAVPLRERAQCAAGGAAGG